MGDNDPTPRAKPHRARSQWTDDERAQHSASLRAAQRTPPQAIPTPDPDPDEQAPITDTFALVDRDLSQSAVRVVERSRRNSEDPALFSDVVNLADEAVRSRRSVEALERQSKIARIALGAIATAALGGLGVAAKGLYERGSTEGTNAYRLQQVEHSVERIERTLERLLDQRRDPFPPSPPLPTTKGP